MNMAPCFRSRLIDVLIAYAALFVACWLATLVCGCASLVDRARAELDRVDVAAEFERYLGEILPDPASQPDPPATEGEPGQAIPAPQTGDDIDLGSVIWHGPDIRAWAVTSDLPNGVAVSGGYVRFNHTKAGKWPVKKAGSTDVEANPWVVAMVDGRWHAASFEWLRPGQTSKPTKTVAGDHCKAAPLSGDWRPKSGDTLYIGVSALARGSVRSVAERTAFRKVVWP